MSWRAVRRRGKVDKIPYSPRTGALASSTDPASWGSYAEAIAAGAGVGFVFTEHDPFVGVDLDDCRDPETGQIHPDAQRIIDALGSYAEVSPSGRGVKVFVIGQLPASVGHSAYPGAPFFVELYARGRYFTVTGQSLEGSPAEVRPAQAALDALYATLRPARPETRPVRPVAPGGQRVSPGEHAAGRLSLAEARARFNADHPLAELLRGYGAEELRGGWSCPFCQHSHSVTLYISRQGKLFSFSPRCKVHSSHGYDSFGLACLIEHGDDVTAFLRAINPAPERAERPQLDPPHPAEAVEYLTPQQVERRRQEAARKRQQRQRETAARLDAARAVLARGELRARARALLGALLDLCDRAGASTCRPSNAALAERIRISERTITSAFADLEAAGVGRRVGGRNVAGKAETAVWTFADADATRSQPCDLIDHENTCSTESYGAGERGDPPPAAELRYALALAAMLPGPVPDLEQYSAAELRTWCEVAEAQLAAPVTASVTDCPPVVTAAATDGATPMRRRALQMKDFWPDSPAGRRSLDERWQLRAESELVELDAGDVAEHAPAIAPVSMAAPGAVTATVTDVPTFVPAPAGVEPVEPELRDRYYRLTGKARRARADGNGPQAHALERQAAALLTTCATRPVAPRPPRSAPQAAEHPPSQAPALGLQLGLQLAGP